MKLWSFCLLCVLENHLTRSSNIVILGRYEAWNSNPSWVVDNLGMRLSNQLSFSGIAFPTFKAKVWHSVNCTCNQVKMIKWTQLSYLCSRYEATAGNKLVSLILDLKQLVGLASSISKNWLRCNTTVVITYDYKISPKTLLSQWQTLIVL